MLKCPNVLSKVYFVCDYTDVNPSPLNKLASSDNIKQGIKKKSIADKLMLLKYVWGQVLSLMTQGQVAAPVCRIFGLPKQEEDLSLSLVFIISYIPSFSTKTWHQACILGQANGSKFDLTTESIGEVLFYHGTYWSITVTSSEEQWWVSNYFIMNKFWSKEILWKEEGEQKPKVFLTLQSAAGAERDPHVNYWKPRMPQSTIIVNALPKASDNKGRLLILLREDKG